MSNEILLMTKSRSVLNLHSISLRVAAILTLALNLIMGEGDLWMHLTVTLLYALAGTVFVAISALKSNAKEFDGFAAVIDAMLVISVLYQHILATPVTGDHNVTTTVLVIAFILLMNIGLNQKGRLVLIFGGLVTSLWIAMIAIMAWRHEKLQPGTYYSSLLNVDLSLAISFSFTACAVYLLVTEKDQAKKDAIKHEQHRNNLSRFFSPIEVSHLENASAILDLQRRHAAIMFVDLRNFTAYAESAPSSQLLSVLAEYRELVANTIFHYGGTIDKYVGDGVMAVFGQPVPSGEDASQAFACAKRLVMELDKWRYRRLSEQLPAFNAVIGLHYGLVVGGILKSGFQDEFTVVGDAVNVAKRLEGLAKTLDASLVVSTALLEHAQTGELNGKWKFRQEVLLHGRAKPIDIAYVPRFFRNS